MQQFAQIVVRVTSVCGRVLGVSVSYPKIECLRFEEGTVDVRLHANRAAHQIASAFGVEFAIAVLNSSHQLLVAVPGGHQYGI